MQCEVKRKEGFLAKIRSSQRKVFFGNAHRAKKLLGAATRKVGACMTTQGLKKPCRSRYDEDDWSRGFMGKELSFKSKADHKYSSSNNFQSKVA
jgi:hypothetical protein